MKSRFLLIIGAIVSALLGAGCSSPSADFTSDVQSGSAPLSVEFSDLSTSSGSPITGWQWEFGDPDSADLNTSAEQNPFHTYQESGSYSVTLTVSTDAASGTVTNESFISVSAVAPVASFTGAPSSGDVPLTVEFTDTTTPGSSDVHTWEWSFGDGQTSTEQHSSHTYAEPGIYTVSLTVTTDVGSDTSTQADRVTAISVPPTPSFMRHPHSGDAPLTVQFTDTSTPGSSDIIQWDWSFGDGQTSTEQNPSYTFAEPGLFDISLTVTTAVGSYTATESVTVTQLNAEPPVITNLPVYRAYPGYSIALGIRAIDPEGTALAYAAVDLPSGAILDSETGYVTWEPSAEQLGPAYVHFTVTDSGIPTKSSEGVLIFQIKPLSGCELPVCDPATGCEFLPAPLDQDCCGGEPGPRIAEPEAPCPEGRVLHVGRNTRGFGRLQNCDQLGIAVFAQGGSNVLLNFEARCINDQDLVSISARLETADGVLFDGEERAEFQSRPDGFSHVLGLTFALSFGIDVFALEDKEALLSTTLTDVDGIEIERQVRVKLTLSDLDNLPNPDRIVSPAGEAGCISCHRPIDPITQLRAGIKDPHPLSPLSCTDCHGGNNEANTFDEAHVFPHSGPAFIKDLSYDELNEVSTDYIRFVNPGDLRVAQQSCGADSPASSGGGCHQSVVESLPTSVMNTYAGHYKLPRYMAGGQGPDPIYGAVDIVDPLYDPDTAPPGTVEMLEALREPTHSDRSELIAAMDIYLPKSCATCHLSDFGANDAPGKYRSSGCTACHMIYSDDGLSESMDPAILGYFPPHPKEHVLTTAIPTEQCSHCHFQGGRIGLSFRGIREGGFSPENTPPDAVSWGKSIYGHGPDFYFTDEDDTNAIDETPPDLHFEAGMVCADCHIGSDVHGDGYLYASERDQVGIRCEDCHGTVRKSIEEDLVTGHFNNSKGYPMKRHRPETGHRRESTGDPADPKTSGSRHQRPYGRRHGRETKRVLSYGPDGVLHLPQFLAANLLRVSRHHKRRFISTEPDDGASYSRQYQRLQGLLLDRFLLSGNE